MKIPSLVIINTILLLVIILLVLLPNAYASPQFNEYEIHVESDKVVYYTNDTMTITGYVPNYTEGDTVMFMLFDVHWNYYGVGELPLNADGEFTHILQAGEPMYEGMNNTWITTFYHYTVLGPNSQMGELVFFYVGEDDK